MYYFKKIAILIIACIFFQHISLAQQPSNSVKASKEDKLKRMQWWTDARFSMFVHWGLYSYTAGINFYQPF